MAPISGATTEATVGGQVASVDVVSTGEVKVIMPMDLSPGAASLVLTTPRSARCRPI